MLTLSVGQWKAALAGAAIGVACTVLALALGRPARPFLARLAHLVRPPSYSWVDPDQGSPSGTTYRTFFSPTIQHAVSYLIYLPPDYKSATDKRYPVIYWLHGRGGTQREGASVFVPLLNAAIRSGTAPPVIIVSPNGLGFSRWSDSSDSNVPVETIFIHDLIPHIDATYRTRAAREDRAIEGFSMGGFGAAHLAFKYPDLFGAVAMDSAALFDEGPNQEYFEANSPWSLAVRNAGALRGTTAVRMAVGQEDSLLDLNRKFHLLLETLHIEHEFLVFPSVGHNESMIYSRLGPRVASFYASVFARRARSNSE